MIEDVVANIISTLQSNLPTELDAVDAARGSSLTDVATAAYYRSESPQIEEYPAIFVLGNNTPMEGLMGRGAANAKSRASHSIDVWVVVRGQDREAMTLEVYRYVEAMDKVFRKNATLGGTVDELVIESHGYTPLLIDRVDQTFRRDGGVALKVTELITAS